MESEWKPNVLVIGPGGMKGFKYLGAIWALEDAGYLDELEIIAGVSVGSFISTLWLAGYKMNEIFHIAVDSGIFHGVDSIDITRVITNQGAVDPRNLIDLVSSKLVQKYGFVPTMEKFYMLTGIKLEIFGSDLYHVDEDIYTYETTPELSVVQACMYSAGIPLIFERQYRDGCSVVDGGFSNPYPVDHYDSGSNRVLGIALETQFDSDPSDIFTYVYRCMNQPVTMLRRKIIKCSSDRCRHILLYSKQTDITGLTMDLDTKKEMLVQGWTSTETTINRWRAGIKSIEIPAQGEIPVVPEDEVFKELSVLPENPLNIKVEKLDEKSGTTDDDKYVYIKITEETANRLGLH